MGDAVISVVVERAAAIIEDQIRYEINLVRGVEKELLDLSDKLKTINNVLDDAEKRGVNDQSVKRWLKKLENMAYEMDDILDEWNYSLLKHKMEVSAEPGQKVGCSFIPSSCLCFKKVSVRRDTAKKIENVKAKLAQILKEMDEFKFVISLPATGHISKSWKIQSTSSIELEKVHGEDIDRNKNDIVRKLMLNGGDVQILSIVGMGGLGKTTLAQLIYNDNQFVKDSFDLRIWVCVSDPFDVAGVARGIVESVTKEIIPPNTNQLEIVLEKLRDCISGKKFLLVLDDVWTDKYDEWEPLKINLRKGAPGSKILVTTRNERVAKMMGTLDDGIYRPNKLSDEECWSLMRGISLSGWSQEKCGLFEDVGKKIASKCSGLPLAANVLGRLLQFKDSLEEWEDVWKSEIWQLEKVEVDLFPHLVLSYNELSPALKHCFSYCAIYPKDSKIRAENMIEEWMALGYLGSVSGTGGVELKGRECLNNLAMLSLFQDIEKSGEQIGWCKMHDIVHDFALFLRKNDEREEAAEMRKTSCQVCDPLLVSQAQEYRSLFWDKRSPPDLCDCVTSVRVLRFARGGLDGHLPRGMEKLIHLRWLGLGGTVLNEEDLKIICRLYFLQTLMLSSCYLTKIPGEIGDLVHLRNLDLSVNGLYDLPESMCSLVELRILDIHGCEKLSELPEWIHMLKNLQHILMNSTPARFVFPEGVARLSGLRTLGGIGYNSYDYKKRSKLHVGSGGNKFEVLKNLNLLTGLLKLNIKVGITCDVEELARTAGEAQLKKKRHLQKLVINFYSRPGSPSSQILWMKVIEALEPNQKLNTLKIRGYGGHALPRWLSSPLNSIKKITLRDLPVVSSLKHIGKLPLLEYLLLESLPNMEVLGREFLGIESSSSSSTSNDVVVAFPKLKALTFDSCNKWSEWEDITEEEEESAAISIMPCLTELSINYCNSLKKLPHRLLHKASSSLRLLDIKWSSELKNTYGEDKEGSPWRSISQHNPQLKLVLGQS